MKFIGRQAHNSLWICQPLNYRRVQKVCMSGKDLIDQIIITVSSSRNITASCPKQLVNIQGLSRLLHLGEEIDYLSQIFYVEPSCLFTVCTKSSLPEHTTSKQKQSGASLWISKPAFPDSSELSGAAHSPLNPQESFLTSP